mmetsp:Transcript_7166/g.14786  ORF Transcript_7166/g.14786 Transcript_7166/m.14786 type:complete len:86 (-) Transcript_7166:631-888(-)
MSSFSSTTTVAFSENWSGGPPQMLHRSNSALKVGAGEMVGGNDNVGLCDGDHVEGEADGLVDLQEHTLPFCTAEHTSGLQKPASQ